MPARYVLLGDVVESRRIADRETFGTRFTDVVDSIAETYAATMYARLATLKGVDEFGGVLDSLADVWSIVRDLSDRLHPHEVRIAVAYGEIDLGAESGDVSKMDGPAFHRAAEQLRVLEETGLLFDVDVSDETLDAVLADEVNLLLLHRRHWSDRQREVIQAYERHGDQRSAAEELEITQQAVSESLRRSSWPEIKRIEERLARSFGRYDR